MISKRTLTVASVFACLFIIGFVLMGYEMLGSRYLNPHFGGDINTWAGLISVVLLAMMVGYMTGGYLVDSRPNIDLLSIICMISGLSIAVMPMIASPMLEFILDIFGDQLVGVLVASTAISFIPVALLSASSPFVVRLLLNDLKTGGQTAGWVYSVSTLGNVFGTLVTTFTFVPSFGTKTITLYFGITLMVLSVIIFLFRNRITLGLRKEALSAAAIALAVIVCFTPSITEAASASEIDAHYPEGPLNLGGKLYYAEMTAHKVSVVENNKIRTFWTEKGCGPTSISRFQKDKLLVLCHLQAKLVVLSSSGKKVSELQYNKSKRLFQDPNDSHEDGNGGVFFSDAGVFRKGAKATGIVYHISHQGSLRPIVTKLNYANGVAYNSVNRILYVSEHLAGKTWAYHLASDFSVKKKELILDISKIWKRSEIDYPETGPDGIELLKDGSIAIAIYGKGTIIILDHNKLRKIPVRTKFVTNIAQYKNNLAITGAFDNQIYPYKGSVSFIPYSKSEGKKLKGQ